MRNYLVYLIRLKVALMKDNFLIIKNMKLFINSLDEVVNVIPNRDRLLKDKLYNTSYDILYYLNIANLGYKKEYGSIIIANISMLDFYLERCLKNKYITSRVCEKKSGELLKITKMVHGWLKSEGK